MLSASANPAILLDGLLYVRCWNKAALDLLPQGTTGNRFHLLAMTSRASGCDVDPRNWRSEVEFVWLSTAPWARQPEYRALVHGLSAVHGFREQWLALASRDCDSMEAATLRSIAVRRGEVAYEVVVTPAFLPSPAFIMEFVPRD